MTTNTTLNAAAESCLALAACLHAVGDDATTLYRVAPFAAAIAQREARDESLEDAAGIWRDMGCAMHPKLPADLVPWRLINAGTINTVRALVGDLAAYLPELRAMYADLDDLAARLAAQPDPRVALVMHLLAKRAAGVLRGYEFHEEARIALEAKKHADRAARLAYIEACWAAAADKLAAHDITVSDWSSSDKVTVVYANGATKPGLTLPDVEDIAAALPAAAPVAA